MSSQITPASSTASVQLIPSHDNIQLNAKDCIDRFTATLKVFQVFAELGAYAPHPTRPEGYYGELPEPYLGEYPDCSLQPASEQRLRQAYELSRHVLSDAGGFAQLTGNPNKPYESTRPDLAQLIERRQALQTKLVPLKNVHKAQLAALQFHPVLTKAVFESLRLNTPISASITPIAPQCLALMAKAQIEVPANSNPLGLYQALGKSLLEKERAVMTSGLEILRDELHAVRMAFYEEMGKALQAQAQTVIDEYALTANAELLTTEDEIYNQLKEVLADPLNTDWPAPSREDKEQPSGFGWMD